MKKLLTLVVTSLCLAGAANAATFKMLTPLVSFGFGGTIDTGLVPYVTSGQAQSGYAFDPLYTNVVLIDRKLGRASTDSYSTGAVCVLDGLTGTLVNQLSLTNADGSFVVTNGSFYMCAGRGRGRRRGLYVQPGQFQRIRPVQDLPLGKQPGYQRPLVAFDRICPPNKWFTNPPEPWGPEHSTHAAPGSNTQIICGTRTASGSLAQMSCSSPPATARTFACPFADQRRARQFRRSGRNRVRRGQYLLGQARRRRALPHELRSRKLERNRPPQVGIPT